MKAEKENSTTPNDAANTWRFRSESGEDTVCTVTGKEGDFTCTCHEFDFLGDLRTCRHVRLIRNGLLGPAIHEEPWVTWGLVDEIQTYPGRIVVPFLADWDEDTAYRTLWRLRQLGISRRECFRFMNLPVVNDDALEAILKTRGILDGCDEVT